MKSNPLSQIEKKLLDLQNRMKKEADKRKSVLQNTHPQQREAALNLIHYLTLRNEDIRTLQDQLHIYGLSSLASSESHIYNQIESIRQRLKGISKSNHPGTSTYDFSQKELKRKSRLLFGEKMDETIPYVMVTFDKSFAGDYAFIKSLLQNGMNVARINCAHDDELTWSGMIQMVKRATRHTGLKCRIYMDLAGPKIRTQILLGGTKKGKLRVREGELVWLAYDSKNFSSSDKVVSPNEPGILSMIKPGERVFIDDGKIKGVIEESGAEKASVRIVRISANKPFIKNDKGLNFPDSEITISSLTEFDRQCLPFICQNADLVGYSFVRTPADVEVLQQALSSCGKKSPSIILKIETNQAVKNLPALLLKGMRDQVFGIMIARGDLAVEIGFERLGEIQEEILWICEAAHAPVVWATQVLESLNKYGLATRSEITDAAHAALAECVMINKGNHTVEVIETLRDILQRMGGHHIKKRYTFRPLNIARNFFSGNQKPA